MQFGYHVILESIVRSANGCEYVWLHIAIADRESQANGVAIDGLAAFTRRGVRRTKVCAPPPDVEFSRNRERFRRPRKSAITDLSLSIITFSFFWNASQKCL